MPCVQRQQFEKGELGSAISIPERVDCIERCDKLCSAYSVRARTEIPIISTNPQIEEQYTHLIMNVLRVAKNTISLAHADRARLACPNINVAKKVLVNGIVITRGEAPLGQRLVGSLLCNIILEPLKLSGIRMSSRLIRTFVPG